MTMTLQTAANLAKLQRAGYEAAVHLTRVDAVVVQDPVMGYNSGKYGLDGHKAVTVRNQDVSKFISARS